MALEDAARVLSAAHCDVANVVNKSGKHLGRINLSDVISTMVPAKPAASGPSH